MDSSTHVQRENKIHPKFLITEKTFNPVRTHRNARQTKFAEKLKNYLFKIEFETEFEC